MKTHVKRKKETVFQKDKIHRCQGLEPPWAVSDCDFSIRIVQWCLCLLFTFGKTTCNPRGFALLRGEFYSVSVMYSLWALQ